MIFIVRNGTASVIELLTISLLRNLATFKVVGEITSDVKKFEKTAIFDLHWYFKLIRCKVVARIIPRRLGARLVHIEKSHETILWVSLCAPSLGDVLMDVSARKLLHERTVNLLTSPLTPGITFS